MTPPQPDHDAGEADGAPARHRHLLEATDAVIAAADTTPLEALLGHMSLHGGVAVVELVAGLPPALADDTHSWALLAELSGRVRALDGVAFSRVSRQLGEDVVAICAAWDDAARLIHTIVDDEQEGAQILALLVLDDGYGDPAAWRLVLPAGQAARSGLPQLLVQLVDLVERTRQD